jgi:HAD superfamily, subfamily IIIB (Acid phosphatase)
MTRIHPALRKSRALPVAAAAVAAALAALAFVSPGLADAHNPGAAPAVPAPPANPTSASQFQNIDQVKTAIKAYYKDTAVAGTDPTNGQPTTLHYAAPDSAYASEMAGIEATAQKYLKRPDRPGDYPVNRGHKAIVLDIDDTTLNTYDYEIYSNFVYNPTSNAAFVNTAAFPAVFGMPQLVDYAASKGYTIFFLTGRPITQLAGTVTNLTNVGYPSVPTSQIYLKDLTAPWLASCATSTPACTTIQYKSLTRKHIESLGYRIVANFGDQFSDLTGGYADKTFKLPNPMYYLP